jgi:synaptic vesicle membrane protein VAT-1
MQAVFITKAGGPKVVQIREVSQPAPGDGQALVKVEAAGFNYAEVVARSGFYPDAPKFPFIPGYEFAGIVSETENAANIKPGDRVMGVCMFGAQAQYVTVSEDQLLVIPDKMSFEEASAIPVNYITAYFALFKMANLKDNEKVLIHACAGGVGVAATQLALIKKAELFGTTSSDEKAAFAKKQGIAHAINYKRNDFATEITRLTNGEGVNIVLDSVGGQTFRKSLNLLTPGGRIICYGVADMLSGGRKNLLGILWKFLTTPKVKVLDLIQNNRCIFGLSLNRFIDESQFIIPVLAELINLYTQGIIKPIISKVFKLNECAEAHALLESGKSTGKLILNMNY